MQSSKLCSKKNVQLCIKMLVLASIIGLYFIVLLRESFAAWELTKAKNANILNVSKHTARSPFKRHERKYRPITSRPSSSPKNQIQPSTTLNPIYEYSEEINIAAEHDYSQRRLHLEESCQKNHINGRYPPNAWEFFISPGHGIAWCNIFKAASSTWMYYFNILGGYDIKYLQRTNTSPLELARKRFPRPTNAELQEALSTSLSFLIVREPFERLLSAYRNKLERCRNKYYKSLGTQIVKTYRTTHKQKPPGPTFKEFVLFLIDNYKNKTDFDEHWAPIYTFCTPCSINFTIIAKVETFERDSEYIIRQTGLETLLLNLRKAPAKKMHSISNQSVSETAKLIKKYFSQIDKQLLNELLNIYGPDFDLFDYDSTKYYGIVQTPTKAVASTTIHGTNQPQQQQQPPMNKSA